MRPVTETQPNAEECRGAGVPGLFIVFIVGVSYRLRFVRVGYKAHAFCVITAVCIDSNVDPREAPAYHVKTEKNSGDDELTVADLW